MRKTKCLRCDARMKFGMQQKFQMGQTSFLLGDWPNLMAGALELEVWFCPKCGKVEFFVPGSTQNLPVKQPEPAQTEEFDYVGSMVNEGIDAVSKDGMPQKKCPTCGREHDFDYPRCPYCKHDYYAK
jgi:rubrerythrin